MLDAVPPVILVAKVGEMHLLSVLAAAENRLLETTGCCASVPSQPRFSRLPAFS